MENFSAKEKNISILTYNVLADQFEVETRVPALLQILKESDADIIALQEVDYWFLPILEKQDWVKQKYHGTKIGGRTAAPGGQYTLTKFPIKESYYKVLPGKQQRTVLLTTVKVYGQEISLANTHMESFLEDGPIRAKQLEVIFELLKEVEHAIFLGDFNFGDGEEPDTSHIN